MDFETFSFEAKDQIGTFTGRHQHPDLSGQRCKVIALEEAVVSSHSPCNQATFHFGLAPQK